MHWLPEPRLREVYRELATVLRPGAVFLNGDHLSVDDTSPALGRLERAVHERQEARRFESGRPEDWRQWWEAIAADPALAEAEMLRAERSEAAAHNGSESGELSTHTAALRDAGFGEIGTLWQRGHDRLLCAIRL
ncbi:hypothetical protein Pth03_48580 [Planotetraspora thailandica]|uniref:Methyltransferase n=1 Tax=Planotetraspora thailandica TaxID=487172 RepID=A0A8J3V2D3_9ACTN|nr:hypothetical protein Pth03_48580 [Planotetraspora thailandica]